MKLTKTERAALLKVAFAECMRDPGKKPVPREMNWAANVKIPKLMYLDLEKRGLVEFRPGAGPWLTTKGRAAIGDA